MFLVQFVNVYCNVVVFFIESKVEEGGHRESLTHLHVTAICSRCAKKEEYKSWLLGRLSHQSSKTDYCKRESRAQH